MDVKGKFRWLENGTPRSAVSNSDASVSLPPMGTRNDFIRRLSMCNSKPRQSPVTLMSINGDVRDVRRDRAAATGFCAIPAGLTA